VNSFHCTFLKSLGRCTSRNRIRPCVFWEYCPSTLGGAVWLMKKWLWASLPCSRKIPTLKSSKQNHFSVIIGIVKYWKWELCLRWNTTTRTYSKQFLTLHQMAYQLVWWQRLWVLAYRANHLFNMHFESKHEFDSEALLSRKPWKGNNFKYLNRATIPQNAVSLSKLCYCEKSLSLVSFSSNTKKNDFHHLISLV